MLRMPGDCVNHKIAAARLKTLIPRPPPPEPILSAKELDDDAKFESTLRALLRPEEPLG